MVLCVIFENISIKYYSICSFLCQIFDAPCNIWKRFEQGVSDDMFANFRKIIFAIIIYLFTS